MSLLLRVVKGLFQGLLALLILFEEWGWEPLQRLMARLARWHVVAAMERRIAALSPLAALGVLLMPPVLLVLPVKLFGAWLVLQGRIWLGMTVIVLIKLLGTAILARLFQLARPALMQMDWFARGYARWVGWKEALLQHVRASWPWRVGRVLKRALRRRWQAWRLRHGA